ncbi:MAG: glycosyltransferase family 2 protein [Cyclobacteriaceae bacterium]|nr:glycosyltransferase family 2 protein [Cyclobacteriaceae bacterium]
MDIGLYLRRYAYPKSFLPAVLSAPPHMAVVIPSYNEASLPDTLQSLRNCHLPKAPTEVIVVINHGENAPQQIKDFHEKQYALIKRWSIENSNETLSFQVIYAPDLPAKTAGVGLARKIGMDEAVRRLNSDNSIIVCLDGDCLCPPNYLQAIEAHFDLNPSTPGCAIYYEHPLAGSLDDEIYSGITHYELFLRYYVHAQRYAGFPYAFQTVGSSMATRCNAYIKQGGMNKRKAGEDFYFLTRIIALGGFTELSETTVIPSPRLSDRVPFGTGKAMSHWLENQVLLTYPVLIFKELRHFLLHRQQYRKDPTAWQKYTHGTTLGAYLHSIGADKELSAICGRSPSAETFDKHFFHWFNGFRVMKYANYAREQLGGVPVSQAAAELWSLLRPTEPSAMEVTPLLMAYRNLDRSN